jgi:integrase
MRKKITKASVEALKPGDFIWDTLLTGFGCKCTAVGKRVFIIQYRLPSDGSRDKPRSKTAPRRYTLGPLGEDFTADQARDKAKTVLGGVRDGLDPGEVLQQKRDVPTLEEFAKTYHAKRLERSKRRRDKKERSKEEDNRNLKLHIIPKLGKKKLADITTDVVDELHTSMSSTPIAANRCLALLSHMFTIAMAAKDMPRGANPCATVTKFDEEGRERFLSRAELSRLGEALRAAEKTEHPSAVAAIRLLILTGCRLSEILTLQWDFIDFDGQCLRLPDSKTGRKIVPVAAAAMEVLKGLKAEKDNPFALIGAKAGSRFVGLQRPWQRIRKAAELEDVRLHDLRHSFASVAASGGEGLPVIGKLLGHKQAVTTQRYAHVHLDPLVAVAERVAGTINAAMGRQRGKGAKRAGKVIKFPGRRRNRRAKRA